MKHFLSFASILLLLSCAGETQFPKTIFQTSQPWKARIDVRADAALVYGTGGEGNLEKRMASWQERGYATHFMAGIAWGGYQDYFSGAWDGQTHWEDGQVEADGDTLWHGRGVPYIVPSQRYLDYFKETQIRRAIDAGADALFLEEPEFWARAGYSEGFKAEWEAFYGSPWMPQDSSPEATYRANKLKYQLYYRALDQAFTYAKDYGRSLGRDIRCYVPTHSLINYAMWEIVSPEASLAQLPCVDGYIAQVWTGTSRVPTYYQGRRAERIFETAFLEYGCMASMTAPTGRELWLLTDPIEDAGRDWEDYRRGYHATFTAQLLYPQLDRYEVMPWPDRIYGREYPVRKGSAEKSLIPAEYATMMGVLVNALQRMPKADVPPSGPQGISVLMGNSIMFQRFPVHEGYEDPQLSHFFGLALPLLKAGVPVGITHIENLPGALKDVKLLLMSYAGMKPLDPAAHEALRDWVLGGGKLLYAGEDKDPFQRVGEWWNQEPMHYAAPSDHLLELLGLEAAAPEGRYPCGKGELLLLRRDPKDFVLTPGEDALRVAVERLYGPIEPRNHLLLQRGPYTVAAVMDEGPSHEELVLEGSYIDLYDPQLPVCQGLRIAPGTQKLLYDLSCRPRGAAILAEAGRSYPVRTRKGQLSYLNKGPEGTQNRSRISLPERPQSVDVSAPFRWDWDPASRTLLLEYPCRPDGVNVSITY